jgi:hypothetical protein
MTLPHFFLLLFVLQYYVQCVVVYIWLQDRHYFGSMLIAAILVNLFMPKYVSEFYKVQSNVEGLQLEVAMDTLRWSSPLCCLLLKRPKARISTQVLCYGEHGAFHHHSNLAFFIMPMPCLIIVTTEVQQISFHTQLMLNQQSI